MTLWMSVWLALFGCTVDETGYGDTDLAPGNGGVRDSGTAAEDDAADADTSVTAPEDLAGMVLVSPLGTLSDVPVTVTVVGLPGAVGADDDLSIGLLGEPGFLDVAVAASGAFVGRVGARLGDTILVVDDDDVRRFVVHLDADAAAPGGGHSGLGDTGEFGDSDVDTSFEPRAKDGLVAVGDGDLPLEPGPYVAYIVQSGASVVVAKGQTGVTLDATAGQTLCAARVWGAEAGRSFCWTVR